MCILVFFQSVKGVSAYQTWVFLYPTFHFSIDLSTFTLKDPQHHRSTKQSSIPPLHLKDSLGPGQSHSTQHWQASLALLPGGLNLSRTEEAQNIKLPWAVNFLALSIPPSVLSSVSLLVILSFCYYLHLSWLLDLRRSLPEQWSGLFFSFWDIFHISTFSNIRHNYNIDIDWI